MSQASKKIKHIDIIVIAVILLLVGILAVMSQRSCTITLPAPEAYQEAYLWCEVYNDGSVATCSDSGMVSLEAYALKYTPTVSTGEGVVIFACVDAETGEEIMDRVAYKITATGWGFLSAVEVEVPEELENVPLPELEIFETESQALPNEPTDACGVMR